MPDIKKDIQKALFEEASQLVGGRFVDQSYKNIVAEVISIANASKEGSYIKITKEIIQDIDLQKKAKEFEESKTREQQDKFLQKIIQPQLNSKQHKSNEDLALIKRNLHDFFSQAVYIISDKENLDKINTKTKEKEGKTDGFTFSPKSRGQENASNKDQQLEGLKVELERYLDEIQQGSKNFLKELENLKELETLKTTSDLYFDPISPLLEKQKVKDAISGLSGKKLTESEISKSIRSKDLEITGGEANDIRNFLQSPAIRKKIQDGDLNFSEKDIEDSLDEDNLISKISGEEYQLEFSKNNFTNFLNEKIISSNISIKHNKDEPATIKKTADINKTKLKKLIENPDDLTNLRRFIKIHAKDKKNEQVLAILDEQNPLVEQAKAAVEQVIEDWGITYKDKSLTTAQSADLNPEEKDTKESNNAPNQIAPSKPSRNQRATGNKFLKYALLSGGILAQFETASAGNLRGAYKDQTEDLHRRAQGYSYDNEFAMNDGKTLFLVSGNNTHLFRGESEPQQVARLENAINNVRSFNPDSNRLVYADASSTLRSISIDNLTFVDIDTGQTTVVATSTTPEMSTTTTTSITLPSTTPTSTTPTSTTLTSTTTTTTTPTTTGTGTTTTSTTTITTTPESEYNVVDDIPTLTCRDGSNQDSCRLEFSDGVWKVYAKNIENGISIPANSNVDFNGQQLTIQCPGEQTPYQLSLNNGDITQISCGENKINVNSGDDVQFVNQNGKTVAQVTTSTTTTQSSITSTTTFSSSFSNVSINNTNADGNNVNITVNTEKDDTTVTATTTTKAGTTVATTTTTKADTAVEEVKAKVNAYQDFVPVAPNAIIARLFLQFRDTGDGGRRLLSENQLGDKNKQEGTNYFLLVSTVAFFCATAASISNTCLQEKEGETNNAERWNRVRTQAIGEIPQIATGIAAAYFFIATCGDIDSTQKKALMISSVAMQLFNSVDDVLDVFKNPNKKTDLKAIFSVTDALRNHAPNMIEVEQLIHIAAQLIGIKNVTTPIGHLYKLASDRRRQRENPPVQYATTDKQTDETSSVESLDRVTPNIFGRTTSEPLGKIDRSESSQAVAPPGALSESEVPEERDVITDPPASEGNPPAPEGKPAPLGNPSDSQRGINDDGQSSSNGSVHCSSDVEVDMDQLLHVIVNQPIRPSGDSPPRSNELNGGNKSPSTSAQDPSTPNSSNTQDR